jgi:hypothetical protein
MKNIKDYTESIIDLTESLLDDVEDQIRQGDKWAEEEIIKKWMTNDKCKMWKQKKGWLLVGNFKMSWDKPNYDGPIIKRVQGNFSVYKSSLESCENLFAEDGLIEGTLTIEDNPNLVSLKGLPDTVNSLTISGNKKLKDIDTLFNVGGNAFVSKNGKKFTKDELASKINVYKNIFCSIEPYDILVECEMIMEAFKAPQLKIIYDALKEVSKDVDKSYRMTFDRITQIEWDKLDASDISEVDVKDSNCEKMIRKYVARKVDGFFVELNKAGQPLRLFYGNWYLPLNSKFFGWRQTGVSYGDWHRYEWKLTEILNTLTAYKEDAEKGVDSVIFIEISNELRRAYNEKRNARREAQHGAIALNRGYERKGNDESWSDRIDAKNVRYYQKIADENRERYKKMLIKLKAERATQSNVFNNIKARLDKAFDRYTALLSKMASNPSKYNSWDIRYVNDKFHSVRSSGSGRHQSYYSVGLFPLIHSYMDTLIDASGGHSYGSKDVATKLKDLETAIVDKLVEVELKITELEAK